MRRSTQKSEALSIDGVLPARGSYTDKGHLHAVPHLELCIFIYITLYQNKLDLSNQEALVFILALSLDTCMDIKQIVSFPWISTSSSAKTKGWGGGSESPFQWLLETRHFCMLGLVGRESPEEVLFLPLEHDFRKGRKSGGWVDP